MQIAHPLKMLMSIVLLASITLSSCGTTTSLVSIKDESFSRKPVRRILVVGVTDDLQLKDAWENVAIAAMCDYEVLPLRALDIVAPLRQYSNQEIATIFSANEIELVLTFSVMDFWNEYYKSPEWTTTKSTSNSLSTVTYSSYNPIFTVNTSGSTLSTTTKSGGVVFSWEKARLDVRLLRFAGDTGFSIVWRSHSTTSGDIFTEKGAVIIDGAKALLRKLADDGFVISMFDKSVVGELSIISNDDNRMLLGVFNGHWADDPRQDNGTFSRGNRFRLSNVHSPYVSDTSNCSVCNPAASRPPALVDSEGNVFAYLTVNQSYPRAILNLSIQHWLRTEICKRSKYVKDTRK